MQGWAKQAKQVWPDCRITESDDFMEAKDEKGDVLVSAKRNGLGQMMDNKEAAHAKHTLGELGELASKAGK